LNRPAALQNLPAPALQTESLPLLQAVGRIAAEPVLAAFDMPAFDNSAMDGFAIAFHADTSNTEFHLIGTVLLVMRSLCICNRDRLPVSSPAHACRKIPRQL
jgi:molybdopterin biosynthesis enzyme